MSVGSHVWSAWRLMLHRQRMKRRRDAAAESWTQNTWILIPIPTRRHTSFEAEWYVGVSFHWSHHARWFPELFVTTRQVNTLKHLRASDRGSHVMVQGTLRSSWKNTRRWHTLGWNFQVPRLSDCSTKATRAFQSLRMTVTTKVQVVVLLGVFVLLQLFSVDKLTMTTYLKAPTLAPKPQYEETSTTGSAAHVTTSQPKKVSKSSKNDATTDNNPFKKVLRRVRTMVSQQMTTHYPHLQLADLAPASGGRPRRGLIVTTWRSGSTFISDILQKHPATFYNYEPLLYMGITQVRPEEVSVAEREAVLDHLRALMHCDYHFNISKKYLSNAKRSHADQLMQNQLYWKYCQSNSPHKCYDPNLLEPFCSLFPFQIMKTVRLRAAFAQDLMASDDLNLQMVLLVRDPRGTLQSRTHRKWCPGKPDCDDPKRLCDDLEKDFHSAVQLSQEFPGRVRIIRYEDFCADVYGQSKELLGYFRFHITDSVTEFLNTHTKKNHGPAWSTFRDTKTAPYHWKSDFNFTRIMTIQKDCAKALELWGYRYYHDEKELNSEHSVLPFKFS